MAYLIKSQNESRVSGDGPFIGHIPGVWSRDWEPIGEAFDFIIAKATNRWSAGREKSEFAESKPLSENTVLALGYDLTNFFDWLETRKLCWRTAGVQFLIQSYATDLASGIWSKRSKRGLAEATVKRRTQTAAEFLKFSGASVCQPSARQALVLPSMPRSLEAKDAPVRQDPRRLRLPTLPEIECWLLELKNLHGTAPYLIGMSIFGLGLRCDEALSIHADQVPLLPSGSPKTVSMAVCYGTKGKRTPGDPDRRGKERTVQIPTSLLKLLHTYKRIDRKRALETFRRKNPGEPLPSDLFLSKHTGRPLSYSRFYGIWRGPTAPFDHFSPHLGRHAWACYTLLEKVREEVFLLGGSSKTLAAVVANLGHSLVDIWVKPQLGHVSSDTSNMYLSWVAEAFESESHVESWFDFLDG